MIELTKYKITTGQIIGWINVSNEEDALVNRGSLPIDESFISGRFDWNTYYSAFPK